MGDAEGPGKHRPRVCATRSTFADLGDTRGFRENGELVVYGLELTKDGYYKRTPIMSSPLEEPDWAVKLELRPANMDLEHIPGPAETDDGEQQVTRITNAGAMHAHYKTSGSKALLITGYIHFYTVSSKTDTKLRAYTAFGKDWELLKNPPSGSTLYIELVLGAEAPKDWIEVLPGLHLKWKAAKIVGLVITNPEGKAVVTATAPDVEIKAGPKVQAGIIHCGPNYQFVRLLFSLLPVSDAYLEHLSGELERRETLLKTLKL